MPGGTTRGTTRTLGGACGLKHKRHKLRQYLRMRPEFWHSERHVIHIICNLVGRSSMGGVNLNRATFCVGFFVFRRLGRNFSMYLSPLLGVPPIFRIRSSNLDSLKKNRQTTPARQVAPKEGKQLNRCPVCSPVMMPGLGLQLPVLKHHLACQASATH